MIHKGLEASWSSVLKAHITDAWVLRWFRVDLRTDEFAELKRRPHTALLMNKASNSYITSRTFWLCKLMRLRENKQRICVYSAFITGPREAERIDRNMQVLCFVTPAKHKHAFGTDLQWTTTGPASGGLHALTLRRKARNGVGYSGTPWSGQAVNWNCRTSLLSLQPLWWVKTSGSQVMMELQTAHSDIFSITVCVTIQSSADKTGVFLPSYSLKSSYYMHSY